MEIETIKKLSITTADKMAGLIQGLARDDQSLIEKSLQEIYESILQGNQAHNESSLEEIYKKAEGWATEYKEIKTSKAEKISVLADNIQHILTEGYPKYGINTVFYNLVRIAESYEIDFCKCVDSRGKQ